MTDSSWFDVTQVGDSIFSIREDHHWEKVRAYLFVGPSQPILVDTGTGIRNIRTDVIQELTDTEIIVVTTHCHWDHIGGHSQFGLIYIHEDEVEWLEKGIPVSLEDIRRTLMNGRVDLQLCPDFDVNTYIPPKIPAPCPLKHGDRLSNGQHELQVIHTPGHSPGSICLFEPNRLILVTGDTLYRGTIYANYPSTNPALLYQSLSGLVDLCPSYILPGHNDDHLDSAILYEAVSFLDTLNTAQKVIHGTGVHVSESLAFSF